MKLTKAQQKQLDQLKQHNTLFVGYNCLTLIRTFDKLVEKGLAVVKDQSSYGKEYNLKK